MDEERLTPRLGLRLAPRLASQLSIVSVIIGSSGCLFVSSTSLRGPARLSSRAADGGGSVGATMLAGSSPERDDRNGDRSGVMPGAPTAAECTEGGPGYMRDSFIGGGAPSKRRPLRYTCDMNIGAVLNRQF